MKQTETIGGRKCTIYTAAGAEVLLLQAVDDHDQSLLDSEVATARSLTDVPFNLVAFGIKEWMRELTPWPAPPTFGKQPFGGGNSTKQKDCRLGVRTFSTDKQCTKHRRHRRRGIGFNAICKLANKHTDR